MRYRFLLLLLVSLGIEAQAQFKIDAEYRPRFEFRDGYGTLKTVGSDPAYFVTQRTRLNFNHSTDKLTTRISIQDYRIWGESKLKGDEPGINLYEAWFKYQITDFWSLTAGRQSFNIDNKRLFSAANWNQVSASHDGATIDFSNKTVVFKMLTAFNQSKVSNFGTDLYSQINNYKFLNVIWLEKKIGSISIANLTITDAYQKEGTTATDYYRYTSGLVFKYKKSANDIQLRGFYQGGKNKLGQEVSAFYSSGSFSRKFDSKIIITGGFEYMSGDDRTNGLNQKDHAFDILYGTKHAYNGIMDYFSTPSTTKHAGLVDLYLKADYNKIKNLAFSLRYHHFSLANHYEYETVSQNKFLANEIDLIANYKVDANINLQMGYATLFGSQTLNYIKSREAEGIQHFFYTMITVKPTFFKN